jgi:L-ascorbate metabolism protein UlaG (beta-lactamase superfamily)
MKISWHGQSLIQITDRIQRKKIRVIVNPFSKKETGLKEPSLKADIVLSTNKDNDNLKVVKGKKYFHIDNPGEYEVERVFIQGIPSYEFKKEKKKKKKDKEEKKKKKEKRFSGNTIFTIEINNIKFCHLGDLQQKKLTEKQLDRMGIVDVLIIPVGGNNTIDAEEAIDIIGQIEPGIIIPVHYKLPKLKMDLDPLEKFLKLRNAEKIKPVDKAKIYKKDIDPEKPKIITLKK